MARVHETSSILLALAKEIHSVESKKSKTNNLSDVTKRMNNLIGLINAEKFNFEDLDAWRMGSLMEHRFRESWKNRSDELNNFRIEFKQKIDAGKIDSVRALFELVDKNQERIISEEEITINSINEAELENEYKRKLLQQLKDQIENHFRDIKNTLKRDFKRHEHEIAKKSGKFSQNVLQKKILDTIERMKPSDSFYDDKQLNEMFKLFWESEDVIGSDELQQLKNDNTKSYKEQKFVISQNIKEGFEAAFERPEQFDVAVKQEFQSLGSLQNWKFTEKELLAIKVMVDQTYFDVGYFRRNYNAVVKAMRTSNYNLCMPQIHSRFINLIDQNPYTQKNYDGDVDCTEIRKLCVSFRNAITEVTDEHQITKVGFRTDAR